MNPFVVNPPFLCRQLRGGRIVHPIALTEGEVSIAGGFITVQDIARNMRPLGTHCPPARRSCILAARSENKGTIIFEHDVEAWNQAVQHGLALRGLSIAKDRLLPLR